MTSKGKVYVGKKIPGKTLEYIRKNHPECSCPNCQSRKRRGKGQYRVTGKKAPGDGQPGAVAVKKPNGKWMFYKRYCWLYYMKTDHPGDGYSGVRVYNPDKKPVNYNKRRRRGIKR